MLRIYDDALQIVRRVQPILEVLRRRQVSLADQLDRAVDSTVLGVAEGSRSLGKNRGVHYTRGAASMDKSIACLDLALAKGHIASFDDDLRQHMKRVVGTLLKARRA